MAAAIFNLSHRQIERTCALACLVAAAACKNDIEKIRELNDATKVPSLQIENVDGRTTELGKVKLRFIAAEMLDYDFAEEKHTDFPKGIELRRYRDSVTLESSITADRAVNFKEKKLWEATGHVVVKNYIKQQTLETEKLFWNQDEQKIFTDSWVKITKGADYVVQGVGMDADESFSHFEIRKVFESAAFVEDKKQK